VADRDGEVFRIADREEERVLYRRLYEKEEI
jgi:hypothetical protein